MTRQNHATVAAIPANISNCTIGVSKNLETKPRRTGAFLCRRPYSSSKVFLANTKEKKEDPAMFCRQCEQTQDHAACTSVGVCGKTSETSAIQDTLIHVVKSVSLWAVAAREAGATPQELREVNLWTLESVFSTLTNVNFSIERIGGYVREGERLKKELKELVISKGGTTPTDNAISKLELSPNMTDEDLENFGKTVSIPIRKKKMGDDNCFSLNEIATYGSKGVAAYANHCAVLGTVDDEIMADVHKIWSKIASDEPDMEGLLATALHVGEINAKVLGMLDSLHAEHFGAPVPTDYRITAVEGKAILVSGHDMLDLHALLEQTEGTGVNVYTHGEMLPAHAYPKLKAYPHFVANYGTAWQNQKIEFATFPGPIILTSNCIIEPRRAYKDRIYTMNAVGFDGVKHIANRDFSEVIKQAKNEKGFQKTIEPARYRTTGFNHRAVLPLAADIIKAAQDGVLSRIFLIGGCDGTQWDRSYFTDLAEETPDDSIILTLGCAKNRVIHSKKLLGATLANGLPRVLDMGQCNDSYSAVVVATELAKALDCSVNDLPLSLAISHLEQKAAAVLLTLLSMGVKNIRLGPSLPAYITPDVLNVLVQNYNIMPTGNAQEDLKNMLEGK
eukprot:CAMPEP_0195302804 /NCGR_PEP_ID=MMETSP0707-20130614/31700_1 /TAXON_ID=33640 /ORGANISM="Asterionellopsis glacialis, Strain CCMP134" /LENGTH=617 /DNA_ID=CAMNT_0040366151 /DNA_START=135 /DNA_END=1988 /DNA_ORIENTATION=+